MASAVEFTAGELRDPFRDLFEANGEEHRETPASDFELQGIVWSVDAPQAIINGKVVKPGAVVDGAEVVEIQKNGVRLLVNGEERFLNRQQT